MRINVIEARDLIIRDYDGSSDPYAVINIGAQQFQTRKVYSNLNPTWNFTCEVSIFEARTPRKANHCILIWFSCISEDALLLIRRLNRVYSISDLK